MSAANESIAELDKTAIELASQLDELESDLRQARSDASAAEEQAEELLVRFDEEIRPELQTAVDAEIERACTMATEEYERVIANIVRWDRDWSPVSNRPTIEAAVETCPGPARSRTAAQREADRLGACETI